MAGRLKASDRPTSCRDERSKSERRCKGPCSKGGPMPEFSETRVIRRRGSKEDGMALILVVLVLTSLVAIGTPFVISMKLQERGSVQVLARQRAHLAAISARNHAVAGLFGTHPAREQEEFDEEGIPKDKYDDWEEIQISFDSVLQLDEERVSDYRAPGFAKDRQSEEQYEMRGARLQTLDVTVEDEQGKINLNTAMPNLIGNLLAGSHLSERITYDQELTELPIDDTSAFPADDDPDTVDGIVAILNPIFFTVEAMSYRGKTDTHLTGVFRGEYFSGTWEHQIGWPVFDLRGLKVFLHRYYDLSEGEIDTYRTPQSIREIADWSVIPYFLETIALLGLDLDNMEEWGLTPEVLLRAGVQQFLDKLDRPEIAVDEEEYKAARKSLLDVGIPREAVELVEQFRGKAGLIKIGEIAEQRGLNKVSANAFKGFFNTEIKKRVEDLRKHSKQYFEAAANAYLEIFEQPGLETFTATDFERIRPYLTTTSSLDALWSEEQLVEGEISTDPLLGVPSFRLARYDHFNPGTLVRIRSISDPNKIEFHLAAGAFPTAGGRGGLGRGSVIQGGVILKDALDFEYGDREALVSAQLRHPININTAPGKVIEAVLTGLSTDRFTENFNSVSRPEANQLTQHLLENLPIPDFGRFRELVDEAVELDLIEDKDVTAILLNAVNPNHPRLTISTTGFCYSSGDVFTIESSGLIRNAAGVELAADRFREVVEVAPPDDLEWVLDDQEDWTGFLFRRDAPRVERWVQSTTLIPGRDQHLMTTSPVPLNRRRFEAPALDQGALLPLTTESVQGRNSPIVEHFPETIEGQDLSEGGYTVNISEFDPDQPLSIDLWIKPNTVGGDQVIFDSLADPNQPFENRIVLRIEGSTGEMIFQIYDDARVTNWGQSRVYPCAEIRHPLAGSWRADTWYHVTAAWGSAVPGDQVLMIDQRPVGIHTYLSSLSAPLDIEQENVLTVRDVEFANRLPVTPSTLWIGGELVDYTRREGTRFTLGSISRAGEPLSGRGRRGTERRSHPSGTTVRPAGYSIDILPADPALDVRNPIEVPPALRTVGRGGAQLASALRLPKWTVGELLFGAGVFDLLPNEEPHPQTFSMIRWQQFGNQGAFLTPLLPADRQLIVHSAHEPLELGFPQRGYLQLRYWFLPEGANQWVVREEFVRYEGYGPGSSPQQYVFTNLFRARFDTEPINTEESALLGNGGRIVDVICVSIETDAVDLESRYPSRGVVQITPPFGAVEWAYYRRIAEGKFFIADLRFPETVTPSPNRVAQYFRRYIGSADFEFQEYDPENTGAEDPLWIWEAGTPLVPVVRLARPGPERGDRVIISTTQDPMNPRREPNPLRVRRVIDASQGVFVGFDRPPLGEYLAGELPRLKRFPTGELPSSSSGQLSIGRSVDSSGGGNLDGTIDEVRITRTRAIGDWQAYFAHESGRASWEEQRVGSGEDSVLLRSLQREFKRDDETGVGQELDHVRVVPVPRLDREGDAFFWSWPEEGLSFGDEEFLAQIGTEVFYGEVEDPPGGGSAFLMQSLNRQTEASVDAVTGEVELFEPRRRVVNEVFIVGGENLPDRHGVLAMTTSYGVELLYYEQVRDNNTLINVQRGFFGTVVSDIDVVIADSISNVPLRVVEVLDVDLHARSLADTEPGFGSIESIVPLTMFGATRLGGPIEYTVPVISSNDFSSVDGYLRVDDGNRDTPDEIIGYTRSGGNEFELARDDRTGRPIFRQRFGTPVSQPAENTILTELLARYHDRFEPNAESPHLMRYQRSISIPAAHWDRVSWEVEEDRSGVGRAEVLVYVRFDGSGEWDTDVGESDQRIVLFRDPEGENSLNRTADQLEFRIMQRFEPGAYGRDRTGRGWNDEWKRAPAIDRLTLHYRKDWRIIHREDLPF